MMIFLNQYIFFWRCNQRGLPGFFLRGISPIMFSAPWFDSYPNNFFEPPKFHYQTFSSNFPSLILHFSLPNKIWWKYNLYTYVLSDNDVYKSIYSFEAVTNVEWTKKICEGLNRWALFPLRSTLIPTIFLEHQNFTKTDDVLDSMALPLLKECLLVLNSKPWDDCLGASQ